MPLTLTALVRVRSYELDSFGHVNNAVYLNYLEEARSNFLQQLGLSFKDFRRLGVQLVIAEANVRYRKPAYFGDEIEITGVFTPLKSVSLRIDYTLIEKQSGREIATAFTVGVFINPETGRPIRPPEEFARAFGFALEEAP